jgi:hypothetical protein
MKPKFFPILLLFFSFSICNASSPSLRSGDLIFVSSENSDFEKSIAAVTKFDDKALNFTHVGIVNVTDTGIFVIEATPQKGVVCTSFSEFKTENKNGVLYFASLNTQYQQYTKDAIHRACSHLGKGYDFAFDFDNDRYYCSELVYDAYAHAGGDPDFFETPPMTFKNKETGAFLPYWIEYFEKLQLPIPEGKRGISPTGIAQQGKIGKVEDIKN